MNKNPVTLRHLYELGKSGYAVSVFSVTKFHDGEIVKKKIGGFKRENEYLHQWWHNGKWYAVDGKMKELVKYFSMDIHAYRAMTGEDMTPELLSKLGAKIGAEGFSYASSLRKEKTSKLSTRYIEVRVYRNVKATDHATDIYVALEEMLLGEKVDAVASEFTTGKLKTIADLIAVRGDNLEVFEIKSKGDTLKRLTDQVTEYKTYADKVWVVVDVKLTSRFEKWCGKNHELSDGLGYISYDNGKLEVVRKPKVNIPNLVYLDMLWAVEKEKILVGLNLPHSPATKDGDRSDRIKKACMNASVRYENIAKHVIRSRITNFYHGKHPKNPGMELKHCAGTIPLSILTTIVYGRAYADELLGIHTDKTVGCCI